MGKTHLPAVAFRTERISANQFCNHNIDRNRCRPAVSCRNEDNSSLYLFYHFYSCSTFRAKITIRRQFISAFSAKQNPSHRSLRATIFRRRICFLVIVLVMRSKQNRTVFLLRYSTYCYGSNFIPWYNSVKFFNNMCRHFIVIFNCHWCFIYIGIIVLVYRKELLKLFL